jgi:hypothetical protein
MNSRPSGTLGVRVTKTTYTRENDLALRMRIS